MDFSLTEQQERIIQLAREFGEKEIAPNVADYNREGRLPIEIYRKMGQEGLLGITIPTIWGGRGMDYVSLMRVVEDLGYFCLVLSTLAGMNSSWTGFQLVRYGTDKQKERYLRPMCQGDIIIAVGVTEPQGGSDVATVTTTARRNDKGYVINGQKKWISYAPSANAFSILARMGETDNDKRLTAFIVDKDTPGLRISTFPRMLTRQVDEVSEVFFDNCQVPEESRLGEEGDGLRVTLSGLEGNRAAYAARCCGGIRACLDEAVKFAQERVVRGRPIGKNQLIQTKIADMATNLECARYLTYHLAWLKDSGIQRATKESSMAKLFATDAFMKAATDAVQIWGAQGCSEDTKVARLFRDAKVHQIMEGTSEIHRILIAEHSLGYSH
jgi:alkylation response protein AidB-like acyl-CoA dehydrogenase